MSEATDRGDDPGPSERFLFVSIDGLVGDVAWRVAREGHAVRYSIDTESERDIADGFVEKVDDWEAHVEWADVVVFDDVWGHGAHAERLRAEGVAVVGGTELTDRLEDDRGFAQEFLADAGVDVLPHREFASFDAGIEFVREHPAPYVIKPLGEVQNVKRLLYVGREDDGGDVVTVLRAYERAWGDRMQGFQLQRRAEGIEVAVTGFFDGERFVEPVNVNFEHKRLFPGDVGPSTGEMGTSTLWTPKNELFERTLGRLEGTLATEGYVGSIDLNCIADAEGIYPLEFTPRFGYPAIFIQEAGMETPIGAFLAGLALGDPPDLVVEEGFQVGVRVCVPPFPFDDPATFAEASKDAAIPFADPSTREEYHIEDVKQVDGQWRVAGTSGVVLTAVGSGETMADAQSDAYERVENVVLPNAYYRDDIGDRWDGEGDRLLSWGYLY